MDANEDDLCASRAKESTRTGRLDFTTLRSSRSESKWKRRGLHTSLEEGREEWEKAAANGPLLSCSPLTLATAVGDDPDGKSERSVALHAQSGAANCEYCDGVGRDERQRENEYDDGDEEEASDNDTNGNARRRGGKGSAATAKSNEALLHPGRESEGGSGRRSHSIRKEKRKGYSRLMEVSVSPNVWHCVRSSVECESVICAYVEPLNIRSVLVVIEG
jgi:hypothetical protein